MQQDFFLFSVSMAEVCFLDIIVLQEIRGVAGHGKAKNGCDGYQTEEAEAVGDEGTADGFAGSVPARNKGQRRNDCGGQEQHNKQCHLDFLHYRLILFVSTT